MSTPPHPMDTPIDAHPDSNPEPQTLSLFLPMIPMLPMHFFFTSIQMDSNPSVSQNQSETEAMLPMDPAHPQSSDLVDRDQTADVPPVRVNDMPEMMNEPSLPIPDPRLFSFTLFLTQDQFNQLVSSYSFQGQPPASDEAITRQIKYTQGDTNETCGICLESIQTSEMMARMPCTHVYHSPCLLKWLTQSNTCPHCRYELLTDNEDYNRGVCERMANRKVPVTEDTSVELGQSRLKRSKSLSQLTLAGSKSQMAEPTESLENALNTNIDS